MANEGPKGGPPTEGVRRYSVMHFLVVLVLLLVTIPFVDELTNGNLIEAALLTLVLLSAVLAVGGRRRTLLAAILLVTPALIATWLHHLRPDLLAREIMVATALVFVAFIIGCLLTFILRAPRVNAEVLCAAVATYLLLALLWAFAYTLVAWLVPNSFDFTAKGDPHRTMARFEALYFSFVTLTTVGYGDILPVSNAARVLAMMESTAGVFFLAVLIARLVSLYSSNQSAPSTGEEAAVKTGA
jgi:voltage-gated potassium channel Kch